MMPEYVISQRTKDLVEERNMLVYPSENKKYKLEIYNTEGVFCGYVGENGTLDYPLLLELVQLRKISLDVADKSKAKWWKKNYKHFRENRLLRLEGYFLWK
tara:strand:- start:70 stop:372 length:303 start_codon:yes stop_codon:yes gene_type:complete